jgi:lactate dehydrogenase-like 2-hydroxyacid dehydrogenase
MAFDTLPTFKVLICDAIGLRQFANGEPDISEVRSHIISKGGVLHDTPDVDRTEDGRIHFYYQPQLSTEAEILPLTSRGQFDAVIAAATVIPRGSVFNLGGVRIGAGTGNMQSASWGGGSGVGGIAPLMNTPSFNSRATAQMAMKALLRFLPDLPFDELHRRSVAGDFDTGKNLAQYPTEKLEGKTIAVLGYGNIGREVALLARSFGMVVKIFARAKHRDWIESEGFVFAATPHDAAKDAQILTVHVGLGAHDGQRYANEGFVGSEILNALAPGATLLNFDRGECVDAQALDAAMATGQIANAAIDADLFKAPSGTLTGPLVPYLQQAKKYGPRILVLPHAAADTCHTSRVEGAKQAVDQIIDSLLHKRVTNLKGDLPAGYSDAGRQTVPGVGSVSQEQIAQILADDAMRATLQTQFNDIAALWADLSKGDPQSDLAAKFMLAVNANASLLRKLGLHGPFG